ncbi:P-loop containing nucleoside triphosphate hydrolase protein [Russula aff. rugulosa BPL654]|nr:P-loop containing nucleoside triphosphate hydrolase protein [Russula aff. rugulosa BPL654]
MSFETTLLPSLMGGGGRTTPTRLCIEPFWTHLPFSVSVPRRHASATTTAAAVKEPSRSAKDSPGPSLSQRFQLTEADHHRLKVTAISYYTGRIRDIHEVRGKRNVSAEIDSMELERDEGITVQMRRPINIIDMLGHDITINVERALRLLDGAVLVLYAVSGDWRSECLEKSNNVNRQMGRYNVPRLSFINKMDRPGANPWRMINQIRPSSVAIGVEDQLEGVVDLRLCVIKSDEIPASTLELAPTQKRTELVEQLAEVDDEMAELLLNNALPFNARLAAAIMRATVTQNNAVQPLLDDVCIYLASPAELELELVPAATVPLVALAFQLEDGRFGQLTYMHVYQGSLRKSQFIFHTRSGKRIKVPELVHMHSNEGDDIDEIGHGPGKICAIFGVECASGDTFIDGASNYDGAQTALSLRTSKLVPNAVISLAIKPIGTETPIFYRVLHRFQKEDTTFRQTIISGMGELYLEIYYGVAWITGHPQVAFRETQTGGAGQYAHVIGHIEPMEMDAESGKDTGFESVVMGGNVPSNYIPAAKPVIVEPIMSVEVVALFTAVEVALNDMFGYSNQLCGATQGRGEFNMEYRVPTTMPVLPNVQVELQEAYSASTFLTNRQKWTSLMIDEIDESP